MRTGNRNSEQGTPGSGTAGGWISPPDARGFTLLETLAVIAILAILAGLIAPLLFTNVSERRVEAVSGNLDTLADAIGRFYRDTGRLPPVLEALVTLNVPYDDDFDSDTDGDGPCPPADPDEPCDLLDPVGIHPDDYRGWRGPYIQGSSSVESSSLLTDSWGTPYGYCFIETGIDLNDNGTIDLICVGPGVKADGTRRMHAWAVGEGFRLCPEQAVDAVIVSFGRERNPNGLIRGDPDEDGWQVFTDSDTYEEFDAATRAAAYDADGFLRMAFNDVDETCLTEGIIDERLAGPGRNYYRTVSVTSLAQEKQDLTAQRLEVLATAVQAFYRDTGKLPPILEALITLNAPYDDDGDVDVDVDEDNDPDCTQPCDPPGIDARNYPNWGGPYAGGMLPLASNTRFLDGWGGSVAYLAIDDPAGNLDFTDPTLDGLYQAVLYSHGPDRLSDADYDEEYENVEALTFGDPDHDDIFYPVSLRGGAAVEKIVATRRKLVVLNEAAVKFNLENAPGFGELDTLEEPPGNRGDAVDHLITAGYIGNSHRQDAWGGVMHWSSALHAFYSVGPNGGDDSTENPPTPPLGGLPGGDDIFE